MAGKKVHSAKTKRFVNNTIVHVILGILAVIWVFPIVWVILTSFRAEKGSYVSTFFPQGLTLDNYTRLFTDTAVLNFPQMFMNTLFIAICSCILATFYVLAVSYCLSRLRFKMRKPYMNMAMILGLFPGFMSMVAVYFILKSFDLTNSYVGLILVYSASSGLGYLIAKGFLDTVPVSLREAAYLDGASEAMVFFKVVMPMSKPIIVYTVISSFLVPWMDFVYAKMILNSGVSSQWTVAIGLYNMLEKSLINTYFTQFCAGGVLVSIPISILFIIMQKFYVEGVTGGAVKG